METPHRFIIHAHGGRFFAFALEEGTLMQAFTLDWDARTDTPVRADDFNWARAEIVETFGPDDRDYSPAREAYIAAAITILSSP